MVMPHFLKTAEKLEIQAYRKPKNVLELQNTHVPFSGAPRKHPYDSEKIILISDPYSGNTFYYEFRADDISYVEELPNLVNLKGETVAMARIWVKKGCVAVCSTPFVVENVWKKTGRTGAGGES